MNNFPRVAVITAAAVLLFAAAPPSRAQEFPPPQGKGRVVVLSSGISGASHYVDAAKAVAQLGYDVLLVDSNSEENTHGQALRDAIQKAIGMPNALPGKVALVGFSAGGGISLYYGSQLPDQVAGVVVWYPANSFIKDVPGFADKVQVPIVVFAGGKDHFRNSCCTAAKDQELQTAVKGANKSFELTVYPDADHDFVIGGAHYNAKDSQDAMAATAAALKVMLSN